MNENENKVYNIEEAPEKGAAQKNNGNHKLFVYLVRAFCVIIFGVGILSVLVPDRDFSESENRVLASFPKLTVASIADGSFMKNFETYMSDQFILRDKIISLKTFFDRLSGSTEENGVFIGKDNYLIEKQSAYNAAKVKKITKSMRKFFNNHSDIKNTVAIVPNACHVYSFKLPENAVQENQYTQLQKIKKNLGKENYSFLNVSKVLKAQRSSNQLFYRTDHHWTTAGAYEVFKLIAEAWRLNTDKVEYEFLTVATDFEGTLASKTGIHSIKDTVEICVPKNSEGTYTVTYESEEKTTATLFDTEKLKNKNKYEVFLGGNFNKVIIETTSSSRQTLLLIKDSYANCLIPMLTPYFARIVVVDPRYMTDTIENVMDENNFSHVLFLYNLNTFLEDSSLVDALS